MRRNRLLTSNGVATGSCLALSRDAHLCDGLTVGAQAQRLSPARLSRVCGRPQPPCRVFARGLHHRRRSGRCPQPPGRGLLVASSVRTRAATSARDPDARVVEAYRSRPRTRSTSSFTSAPVALSPLPGSARSADPLHAGGDDTDRLLTRSPIRSLLTTSTHPPQPLIRMSGHHWHYSTVDFSRLRPHITAHSNGCRQHWAQVVCQHHEGMTWPHEWSASAGTVLVVHLSKFVGGEDVGESCAFGGVEL